SPPHARHRTPEPSHRGNVFRHVPSRFGAGEHLEAPIEYIRDVDGLVGSHRHEASPRHLAGFVSRFTEGAEDLSTLIQFDDPVVSSVRHPNVLVGRNQETVWVADTRPLPDEVPICVKDLYTLIFPVANIDSALLVDGDTVRQVEFTAAASEFPPRLDVVSIAVELDDAGIAITVSHVYVAISCERHIGRFVEQPVCFRAGVDSPQH